MLNLPEFCNLLKEKVTDNRRTWQQTKTNLRLTPFSPQSLSFYREPLYTRRPTPFGQFIYTATVWPLDVTGCQPQREPHGASQKLTPATVYVFNLTGKTF